MYIVKCFCYGCSPLYIYIYMDIFFSFFFLLLRARDLKDIYLHRQKEGGSEDRLAFLSVRGFV